MKKPHKVAGYRVEAVDGQDCVIIIANSEGGLKREFALPRNLLQRLYTEYWLRDAPKTQLVGGDLLHVNAFPCFRFNVSPFEATGAPEIAVTLGYEAPQEVTFRLSPQGSRELARLLIQAADEAVPSRKN